MTIIIFIASQHVYTLLFCIISYRSKHQIMFSYVTDSPLGLTVTDARTNPVLLVMHER